MSAQVYRHGDTHVVRGVTCELKNIGIHEVDYYVEHGWCRSEKELIDTPEDDAPEDDAGLNPVRAAARDAGIAGWDTKQLKTLEKALSDA